MAQTPCIRVAEGFSLDRTFAADAKAGDVVLVGTKPLIVSHAVDKDLQPIGAVDSRGLFDIPQKAETIDGGDAVYWDPTGDPVVGDSGSGAATETPTAYPLGRAAPLQPNGTVATVATDKYVRVLVENFVVATTVAGAVTADSILGSDSNLEITGKAGSSGAGGAVTGTGGAGHGAGNVGGAWTITGGAGVANTAASAGGVGGTVNATGGAGGGADTGTGGAGGAANRTGGAGGTATGAGTGGAGGTASNVGGAGGNAATTGTGGAGGAAGLTGGAGGTSATTGTGGAGGAISSTAGVGGAAVGAGTGGVGGAATFTAGAGGAAATTGTGGAGGAAGLIAGAGGATATGTGGAGANITITAGAGGTASGAGTGGAAGNVVLSAGAAGGHSGGTAGKAGMVRVLSPTATKHTVTAKTTAATLTIAELLTGMLTGTHTETGTQAYTLPTGTNMTGGCACGDGEGFEWSLINLSVAATDTITLTAADDHTIVGLAVVVSAHNTTGGAATSMGANSSRWYSRKTTGNTWVTYRIG